MKITIDNKTWKGTVTIFDRLYLPQVELIENALLDTPKENDGRVRITDMDKPKLPALLACVEKWELQDIPAGVTVETFPFTPRPASHQLIEWLWMELFKIYLGDAEVPNE